MHASCHVVKFPSRFWETNIHKPSHAFSKTLEAIWHKWAQIPSHSHALPPLCSSEVRVHPGSWPLFWRKKETEQQMGGLYKTLTQTAHDTIGEITWEREAFFQREGRLKSCINIGQKNFISHIILPSPHCSPYPWAAGHWVLSVRHFGQDFHHFLPHNTTQLWQIRRALLLPPPTF